MRKRDTEKAVQILRRIGESTSPDEHKSFKNAVNKLILAFESPLFISLLDIQEYYESLLDASVSHSRSTSYTSKSSNLTTPESRTTGSVSPRIQSVAPGTHTSESGLAQPEWQYLEVVLKKDAPTGGYGFSIAGGIDFPISEGDPGIYVTRIAPNGCADVDGRLRVDDQILTVNGISLEQVSNLEAVQTMKRAGNSLQLVIRRYIGDFTAADPRAPDIPGSPETRSPEASSDFEEKQLEPVWFEVQLRKSSPTAGLGLSVAGGKDYEHDETIAQGLYVTRINPNGLAHKDGRIQPGDQLMQVNGVDVSHMYHAEAVEVLRNAGQVLNLVLRRVPRRVSSDSGESTVLGVGRK